MLGKIEGRRRRGSQRMRWLDGITNLTDRSLSKFQKTVKDREASQPAVHGVARSWTQLNDFYFSSFFIAMEVSSKPQVLNTGCLLESTEELKNF